MYNYRVIFELPHTFGSGFYCGSWGADGRVTTAALIAALRSAHVCCDKVRIPTPTAHTSVRSGASIAVPTCQRQQERRAVVGRRATAAPAPGADFRNVPKLPKRFLKRVGVAQTQRGEALTQRRDRDPARRDRRL